MGIGAPDTGVIGDAAVCKLCCGNGKQHCRYQEDTDYKGLFFTHHPYVFYGHMPDLPQWKTRLSFTLHFRKVIVKIGHILQVDVRPFLIPDLHAVFHTLDQDVVWHIVLDVKFVVFPGKGQFDLLWLLVLWEKHMELSHVAFQAGGVHFF